MEDFNTMTTEELRKLARKHRNDGDANFSDVTGIQIAGMLRAELIARLSGNLIPEEKPDREFIPPKEPAPKKPAPVPEEKPEAPKDKNDDLADLLARALEDRIKVKTELDEDKVKEIVDSVVGVSNIAINSEINHLRDLISNKKQEITVTLPDMAKVEVGLQHYIFEDCLKTLAIKENVFLVGPSGSGKTYIAESLAKALNLPYYFMLVGPETSKADFFGFRSMGDGQYHSTPFYEAYVNGGLILIDEMDAGNAGVMTMLNMALDNGACAFPNGNKQKHPDCVVIAGANTYGRGADRVYCGRQPLDGATLQRFAVMFMDYDKDLEKALCPEPVWADKIHILRDVVADHKAKIIVSMRAIIKGYKLLSIGFSEEKVLDMTVFQGYNSDARSAILKDWKDRTKDLRLKKAA